MNKTIDRTPVIRVILLGYIFFIFASTLFSAEIWDTFNASVGGKGVYLVYAVALVIAAAILTCMILSKKRKTVGQYILFFVFINMYYLLNKLAVFHVDKIHLIEYSLLSFLVYAVLKNRVSPYKLKFYVVGAAICGFVGVIDEVFQWFIPDRVFDWNDILLNFASAVVMFLIIRFIFLKN